MLENASEWVHTPQLLISHKQAARRTSVYVDSGVGCDRKQMARSNEGHHAPGSRMGGLQLSSRKGEESDMAAELIDSNTYLLSQFNMKLGCIAPDDTFRCCGPRKGHDAPPLPTHNTLVQAAGHTSVVCRKIPETIEHS